MPRGNGADKGRTRQGLNDDPAVGYVASGTSAHSRHAAHGSKTETADEADFVRGSAPVRKRSAAELLRENRHQLGKVKHKLETERDPIKIEKLKKSLEFKTFFIHKLEEEQKHEHQPSPSAHRVSKDCWGEIETIYSEDFLRPEAEWVTPTNPRQQRLASRNRPATTKS